ncbi:unnamed protein product [Adineta steineri]|uniref:General stress protein FMN-binding split barrel domain-containing protein n=1 Tax=Adineta steineri TaxID=433720 RepID=A0A813MU06_9BILA|nr:unnamed protein product [Adineta steineri]CAF4259579.1 unnamed protein product [Adineta steineri]
MAADSDRTKDQEHIFKLIKDIQFAMLTTTDEDGSLRSRPMAYKQGESDSKTELWFFTRTDSSKVPEIKKHSQINVSFSNPSHQSYVSISGHGEIVKDKTKAKELWNPYLKAWFPQELEDPNLSLLKVTIEGAEYWDSAASLMVRAVGYVKAAFGDGSTLEGENKKVRYP